MPRQQSGDCVNRVRMTIPFVFELAPDREPWAVSRVVLDLYTNGPALAVPGGDFAGQDIHLVSGVPTFTLIGEGVMAGANFRGRTVKVKLTGSLAAAP
jgi:hypothetical protein